MTPSSRYLINWRETFLAQRTNKHSCATSHARRMNHKINCASRQTPIFNNKCFTYFTANIIPILLSLFHCKRTTVRLLHDLSKSSGEGGMQTRALITTHITHSLTAYLQGNINGTVGLSPTPSHWTASSSGLF